jgi:hypothetical protein
MLSNPEEIESALGTISEWQLTAARQAKIGKGAQRLLDHCVRRLPSVGVAAFRLGDLVDVLKRLVRQAHAERMIQSQDLHPTTETEENFRGIIRILGPTSRYDNPEALEALLRKVRAAIETMEGQERTRSGVQRLFEELCTFADSDEEIPPWAEFARCLGVRRTTLWDHLERLRRLVKSLEPAS